MAHPGVAFAIAVGIALGALFYYLVPGQNQNAHYAYGHDKPMLAPPPSRRPSTTDSSRRRRKPSSSNAQSNCSICLDEVSSHTAVSLNCAHIFHVNCLNLWLREKKVCPNCRLPITFNN